MILNKAFFVAFATLPSLSFAAPQGSKHSVYLVACQSSDCFLGLCDPSDGFYAAAYFANGPITSGSSTPTYLTKVTGRTVAWEGTGLTVRLGTAGSFKESIPAGAKTANKGDLAGTATLGTEPFVCFKDGSTVVAFTYDYDQYQCRTDYWCASIDTTGPTPTATAAPT